MTILRRWLALAFLIATLTVFGAGPNGGSAWNVADAPAAPAFLLEPVDHEGSYFTLTMEPGDSTALTVALGNVGEATTVARTYVADAYTLVNDGFGVRPEDASISGPSTWLDYPAETLELDADRKVERDFTVAVPAGTKPGQYIAGLVLQTADPVAVGGSEMLKQNIVKAIAVFITVPGPVGPSLAIGEATITPSGGASSLKIEIENTGNVLLKPAGTVTVTTASGQAVSAAPVEMGSVYAGMATTLELAIPTVLGDGEYVVEVALHDEESDAEAAARTTARVVAAAVPSPVTIGGVTVDAVSDPAGGKLQFVTIAVELANAGAPLPSARLTLRVSRNGALVEDFPLNSSLMIPSGSIAVEGRYVPIVGWAPGTYDFTAILEATDPVSGQVTLLATATATSTVTVE
jgi:hypothetical protein